MRLHGNDHRPWTYDDDIEADVRSYLKARARLAPSLIAAGHRATATAFPPVARGDFYWPEHAPAAASNTQYVFLDSVLVAPMDTVCYERSGSPDTETNGGLCDPAAGSVPPSSAGVHGWGWQCGSPTQCNTNRSGGFLQSSRSVWIPPGQWHNAWNGSDVVAGPRTIEVHQPYHQQPMWHKAGSLLVLCDAPGLRVTEQDWSTLTLEIFPSPTTAVTSDQQPPIETTHTIFERSDAASPSDVGQTSIRLLSGGGGDGITSMVRVEVGAGPAPRAWNVRINLLPGQTVVNGSVVLATWGDNDGIDEVAGGGEFVGSTETLPAEALRLIAPYRSTGGGSSISRFFPFGGAGSPGAPSSGMVAEVRLASSRQARVLELQVTAA